MALPEYDKYGHCVCCHKNMIITEIIDQKETVRFTPEYNEIEYLLNDGSKMRVAVCIQCREHIKNDKHEEIMSCVFKGWEEEVKKLDWDEEKKKKYLEEYSNKKIVCHAEGKPKDVLNKKLEIFNEAEKCRL